MDVDKEVESLLNHIARLGSANADGTYTVKYGILFKDHEVTQEFEALLGTLRAAKKRGLVAFEGQMLLSPTHDNVDVSTTNKSA